MSSPEFYRAVDFHPVIDAAACSLCLACVRVCGLGVIEPRRVAADVSAGTSADVPAEAPAGAPAEVPGDAPVALEAGAPAAPAAVSPAGALAPAAPAAPGAPAVPAAPSARATGPVVLVARRHVCRNCRACVAACQSGAIRIDAAVGGVGAGHLKKELYESERV